MEVSKGSIAPDAENLYDCLFSVPSEGSQICRVGQGGHDRNRCTAHNDNPHSCGWLELCKTVGARQKFLRCLGKDVSEIAKKSRREVEGDSQKPIEIRALVGSTEASFTGEILRKAFVAAESADEAKKRE